MSTSLAFDLIARDRASGPITKFGDAVEKSGSKFTKFGKTAGDSADKAGGKFSKMSSLAKAGFAAAGAAALAGGAIVAKGLMTALNVEKATDKMAAALGATPRMAAKFGKVASNLYAGAWGDSMADVTSAVESVASSFRGLGRGKELQRVTAQAMDFATIFEVDLPRATSVASTMISAGLAKNATQALDLLTVSAQRVPKALREDVLDATEEYGQFFNTIGFTGPQAMATLVAASKKGTFGIDKIGDAVKEFTIRATDMSATSTAAYDMIGLDAGRMANLILKGGKAARFGTDEVVNGLLKIKDPAKQANAAIALFGTPIEDLNVKDIPAFLGSLKSGAKGLGDFEGAAQKASDTLNDNAATRLEGFKRQLTTTFVSVLGGQVLPRLEQFGTVFWTNFGPTVKAVADFWANKWVPAVLAVYSAIWDKLGPAVIRFGGWIKNDLMPPLRTLADSVMKGVRDGLDNTKGSMKDLEPAITLVKGAFKLLGAYVTNVLLPMWSKAATVLLPALGTAFRAVSKILGVQADMVIWLWNNAFQPLFANIARGVGKTLTHFGRMLQLIGKAPKMGWVGELGDKMVNAGNKAKVLADEIRDIPGRKDVNVHVNVFRKFYGGPGGTQNYDPSLGGLVKDNATGSTFWRGGPTRMNEAGGEIVDLPRGARIYPAAESRQMMTGGGIDYRKLARAIVDALNEGTQLVRLPNAGRGAYVQGADF